MSTSILSFEAENGDAFLIKFDNGQNILIDMGMPKTYENQIRKELIKLKESKQKIDLLIISHIDADHIGGAIKFLEENKNNEIIEISEIWYNSYKHLQFEKAKVLKVKEDTSSILKSIIKQNQTINKINGVQNISCKQGSSLASLICKYEYPWNTNFSCNEISIDNKQEVVMGNLKFIFLSPNEDKLQKLSKKWIQELSKNKYSFEISDEEIFDDAFEFYMKFLQDTDIKISSISSKKSLNFEELSKIEEKDNSVTNGSSLAFIIEYKDKKLLFLGDSHEDIVFDSLIKLKDKDYDLKFDLMKVSHHGSNKNISNRLINLITCDKFLFSTDGLSHNHPNLEAIAKIVANNIEYKKELFFNYELDIFEKLDNIELKNKYNYEIKYQSEIDLL
ncbi:ComEC/Rec2 family competence protein [Aliarcobacter cryaerophilus]|uniref:ComEC/Rec2 family competence protein n=1 Tax=Aliarcobacter cryaerophilus TaxID=28198 RepID=UPI001654386D|nr:MBL fold metallo-hydrolase [Aliarcobacter cryaerophilus]QNM88697.1 MBL fold metallo-hydrolase [Aliarcobacter cryaerophilus]